MDVKAFLKRINRDGIESNFKWHFIDKYFSWIQRKKLKNKNFTIIGNSCFTGGIYHKFGLKYSSPTIWTYFFPEDYIRFLENLDWYLKQPLEFSKETKHSLATPLWGKTRNNYPIGVLDGSVEIHFMHCKSEKEAYEKWTRRAERINFNNIFVAFSDGEEFKEEQLEQFDKLPFKHKLFFSAKPRSNLSYAVFVKCYEKGPYVFDSTRNRRYEKYVDVAKWLNGETDFLKN